MAGGPGGGRAGVDRGDRPTGRGGRIRRRKAQIAHYLGARDHQADHLLHFTAALTGIGSGCPGSCRSPSWPGPPKPPWPAG